MKITIDQYESMLARGFRVIGRAAEVKLDDGTVHSPVKLRRNGFRDQIVTVVIPPEPVEDISTTAAVADAEVPAEIMQAAAEVIAANPPGAETTFASMFEEGQ